MLWFVCHHQDIEEAQRLQAFDKQSMIAYHKSSLQGGHRVTK